MVSQGSTHTRIEKIFVNQLDQLQPQNHLVIIYDGRVDQWKRTVVPFMLSGLMQDEKCIFITEDETPEQIREYCLELGINLKPYEKKGAFSFMTGDTTYLENNTFDADKMIKFLIDSVEKALSEGYSGLRITGDLGDLQEVEDGFNKVIEYEVKLNERVFLKYPLIALCRYNLNRYSMEFIKNIINVHPYVIWDNKIHENPYYIPPNGYRADYRPRDEANQWLKNIKDYSNRKTRLIEEIKDYEKTLQENYAKLEANLEYEKLKNEFFISLSHELRTPLNLMFTALQLLNSRLQNDEKSKRYLKILKQNNFRLIKLVNNLLDISKIKAGSYKLQLQEYDLVDLVQKVTESVREYISEQGKEIEFISNVPSLLIAIDPMNFERILLNLLSNAVKATTKGDQITVRVLFNKDEVMISVQDTGLGITEEKKEVIFQQFRRVEDSFIRSHEGSGLGLWIVKSLVELHQGTITLLSEPGNGSEFIITLPLESELLEISSSDSENVPNLIDRLEVEFSDIYGL